MGKINFPDGSVVAVDDRVAELVQELLDMQSPVEDGVMDFIQRFKEMYLSYDLVRIGGDGDGGYLLPNILDQISYCFSPGVSNIANFEQELATNYSITSFMADASVTKPPTNNALFNFIPKFLGSRSRENYITLSDWINDKIGYDENRKILQMDIEGGEYDVLCYEDAVVFNSFDILIIEFHWLDKMFKPMFLKMLSAIFEKLYANFSICHAHPNNCCGIVKYKNIRIPRVLEVTFINNRCAPLQKDTPISLPHILDQPNVQTNPDISMPELWWK